MKARLFLSHSIRLALVSSFTSAIALPALADAPKVDYDPDSKDTTITYSKTIEGKAVIGTDKVYQLGKDGKYYFEAKHVDDRLKDGSLVPVESIPGTQALSVKSSGQALSHPAVADKMTIEAAMMSYDSMTSVTRSILKGRIPAAAMSSVSDNLLQETPVSQWLAESSESEKASPDVDYLDQEQDEESGGYMKAVSDGANVFFHGQWFGIVQTYGHYLDQNSMEGMAGFKSSGYGIQGALLRAVHEQWLLGLYGGWQKLNADLKDRNGEVDVGTWRLGPTIAWSHKGFSAEGILTYNWNNVDSKVLNYKGDYKGKQWDAYLRGGYDINLDHMALGLSLTPEVQFLYSNQTRDDYNWNLGMIEQGKTKGWVSRLGGTLTYDKMQYNQPLQVKASLGWQHNDYKTDDLKYRGVTVPYKNYDENAAYYSLGMGTSLNSHWNLNLGYGGTWSKNALAHYLRAGVEFRF